MVGRIRANARTVSWHALERGEEGGKREQEGGKEEGGGEEGGPGGSDSSGT